MEMVQNWRKMWWRRWSTWLAAVNSIFVGYVFSQPVLVIGLIGFAPGKLMLPLAAGAAFFAFVLPVIVTHVAQPKMRAKIEEKTNADQPE